MWVLASQAVHDFSEGHSVAGFPQIIKRTISTCRKILKGEVVTDAAGLHGFPKFLRQVEDRAARPVPMMQEQTRRSSFVAYDSDPEGLLVNRHFLGVYALNITDKNC